MESLKLISFWFYRKEKKREDQSSSLARLYSLLNGELNSTAISSILILWAKLRKLQWQQIATVTRCSYFLAGLFETKKDRDNPSVICNRAGPLVGFGLICACRNIAVLVNMLSVINQVRPYLTKLDNGDKIQTPAIQYYLHYITSIFTSELS